MPVQTTGQIAVCHEAGYSRCHGMAGQRLEPKINTLRPLSSKSGMVERWRFGSGRVGPLCTASVSVDVSRTSPAFAMADHVQILLIIVATWAKLDEHTLCIRHGVSEKTYAFAHAFCAPGSIPAVSSSLSI